GPGAVLDENTNTFIPGQSSGKVADDGSFIPPKNVEITVDGKILVAIADSSGNVNVTEVAPPPPVVTAESVSLGEIALSVEQGVELALPVNQMITPERFAPTGGIQGVNDPTRLGQDKIDTIIRVRNK